MNLLVNITDNMTVYIHIDKLGISANGNYNSTVSVSMLTLKTKLNIITPFIVLFVNGMFGTPFSIEDLLADRGLEFLDFKKMELQIGQGYAEILLTP